VVICGDTSFFFSLYGNDVHSPRAVKWARDLSGPIVLGPFNAFELGNALRFAEFRKMLSPGEAPLYWAQFEAAIQRGRLLKPSCNLADVLDEATRLSATHTLTGGHRAFDILHVAAALTLGAKEFLTFDANQKKLAESEGLNVPL
jgi:predicted nucleic acid-binding protein